MDTASALTTAGLVACVLGSTTVVAETWRPEAAHDEHGRDDNARGHNPHSHRSGEPDSSEINSECAQ